MAKAPAIKFPRIEAGFYTVTRDGALMGYIAKKVEGKETSWMVFNTNDPEYGTTGVDTLPPTSMVEETELFREAKEYAREYFLNMEVMTEEEENEEDETPDMEVETLELQEPEWTESEADVMASDEDLFDEASEFEDIVEEELALA